MRPRKPANKLLPPYLYASRRGKIIYYSYRHPSSGRTVGFGRDKQAAIQVALTLNAEHLRPIETILLDRARTSGERLTVLLDKFLNYKIQDGLAPKSLKVMNWLKDKIAAELGDVTLSALTTATMAELINPLPPRTANMMRSFLVQFFKYLMRQGITDKNPAEIIATRKYRVTKPSMTMDQFQAIWRKAPDWLQDAMELGLLTLQRRSDLVKMRFDDVRDGYLYVIQQKTNHHLRITIGRRLADLIARTDDGSEWLLHHRRDVGEARKGNPLYPDTLEKKFKSIRDELKLPGFTFHDIRGLGARLYQERGVDPQRLLGHTGPRMTARYLKMRGGWNEAETLDNLPILE